MSTSLSDSDAILSGNEHWSKLDEEWGTPIDLDTEDQDHPAVLLPYFSTIDLRRPKPTFDSANMLKRIRQKINDSFSKKSQVSMNYNDFIQELDHEDVVQNNTQVKQFYYVGGQIISATSVDEICHSIDTAFKSVSKLSATTSTIRAKSKTITKIPEVVECSFSTADLSFDDTTDFEKEKSDCDDVNRLIDELFDELNNTVANLHQSSVPDLVLDQTTTVESVTTLVKKFSSILESPVLNCSPRRQRQCCEKFKDLAEFWNSRAKRS